MTAIEVTAVDDGKTVSARPGDEIVVVLPENATTGYRWQLDQSSDPLRLLSDGYREAAAPDDEEPVFGRGGLREFRFTVDGPGTGTLSLKHWREWEGDGSVTQRVSFTIDVAPAD
jgi:inhibitor of cysteine peptidase